MPVQNAEYNNPRLVEVYDAECIWGPDDDFYLALVDELSKSRVLDVGCGTGRLAIALSSSGHVVTGIDPAEASLQAAQRKPGAERVQWILGRADSAPKEGFDIALMTSHVVQFFLSDEEWSGVLKCIRRSLVPQGRIAFNAYDPRACVWDRWNARGSRRSVSLDSGAKVGIWTEATKLDDGIVTLSHHYEFSDGEKLRSDSTLRFRSEEQLRSSLRRAGFVTEAVYGGWSRQGVGRGDAELIFIARRE